MITSNINHIIELPEDPIGGASGAKLFHILFAGKTSSEKFPYVVFNEKVAGEIGRMLGLYCPEVLLERFNNQLYFFSNWQETTPEGTILPSGSTQELAKFFKNNLEYIHGMIVFDIYVGNNDRRRDNIILRSDGKLALIDHGNALLYYRRTDTSISRGLERLEQMKNSLKIMFDKPHRFLNALTDITMIEKWTEKIKQIPDYFITSLVSNLPEMENIDDTIKKKTIEFLLDRRSYLFNHIFDNRNLFPKLAVQEEKQ